MEIPKNKLLLVLGNSVLPDKTWHNISHIVTKKATYVLQDFAFVFAFDFCEEVQGPMG